MNLTMLSRKCVCVRVCMCVCVCVKGKHMKRLIYVLSSLHKKYRKCQVHEYFNFGIVVVKSVII